MNNLSAAIVLLAMGTATGLMAQNDAVSYVNPLIGTQRSAIGYGGTMPFVTPPFGMTDWTPQTRQNKISITSYNYDDTTISGFIGTHQPAIWMGDYGYVTMIPQVGELRTTPESRKLRYSHASETARPDYYLVSLDAGSAGKIRAEMTATERCAFFRFTFPNAANAAGNLSRCHGPESQEWQRSILKRARLRAITRIEWMHTSARLHCQTSKDISWSSLSSRRCVWRPTEWTVGRVKQPRSLCGVRTRPDDPGAHRNIIHQHRPGARKSPAGDSRVGFRVRAGEAARAMEPEADQPADRRRRR